MLKLGEILFRFRNFTPIPLVILIVLFSAANRNSMIIGIIFMVLGEMIRMAGVSHIGGISRTRSYDTGSKVIDSGPFSRVRNPLYIGNFFLTGGLAIASNLSVPNVPYSNVLFVVLYVIYFFGQYIPIVHWEENNLRNIFGSTFEDYMNRVPRWIPSIRSRSEEVEKVKGDLPAAIKSEKYTMIAFILVLAIIVWRSFFFSF